MISSVVRTVLVYLAVVVAMRLMGKRQLGELQPAELSISPPGSRTRFHHRSALLPHPVLRFR